MKRMSESTLILNEKKLNTQFNALHDFVRDAAVKGTSAHVVEKTVWKQILQLGHSALGLFFDQQGSGDVGESVMLGDNREVFRLNKLRSRKLTTVFGSYKITRAVYGSREGQKIDFVPLDTRLQLPEGEYSYLLQDWDQLLSVENSYAHVSNVIERILGFSQPVDSLERGNRKYSDEVESFRQSGALPPAEAEGATLVLSADGKGIPMRREPEEKPIQDHVKKGVKRNKKRMAIVGTAYTVDPNIRTPERIIESLFRDPKEKLEYENKRPRPQGKLVWASLTHEVDGKTVQSTDVVFDWLQEQVLLRNTEAKKPTVVLMDGQESLWEAKRKYLPEDSIEILDLLHVTPRLWTAAHLFCKEGSAGAIRFVQDKLLNILSGRVGYVIGGLRQMGTKAGLKGSKKKTLSNICTYLSKNKDRIKYDEYLRAGYPIATGVVEGACRHLIKDRMERAGMRWSFVGAQAMLDLRSTALNGDWDEFTKFRIQKQTEKLHPELNAVKKIEWPRVA